MQEEAVNMALFYLDFNLNLVECFINKFEFMGKQLPKRVNSTFSYLHH